MSTTADYIGSLTGEINELNSRLAAVEAERDNLKRDIESMGAHYEGDDLVIEMPKYHAIHRCDEHRKEPWRSQALDGACVPCLRAELERERNKSLTPLLQKIVEIIDRNTDDPTKRLRAIRGLIIGEAV